MTINGVAARVLRGSSAYGTLRTALLTIKGGTMKGMSRTVSALVLGLVLALGGGALQAPRAVAQDSKCGVGQIHNLSKSTIPVTVSDWPSGNGTRDRVDPGRYSSITVRAVYIPANYRLTYDGIVVVRPAGYNRWYTTPAVFWPICSDIWIRK